MTYNTIGTIDSSGGTIARSSRGFAGSTMLLLDNPILKLDFTNAASSYVVITFTDLHSDVVAEWTVDNTLKVNYVEIGDVLRYAVEPKTLTGNVFTNSGETFTVTFVSYDSNNNALKTTTLTWSALRSSKLTSPHNGTYLYYSLPSKFRMMFAGNYYNYSTYNIIAGYPRTASLYFRVYNGSIHNNNNYVGGSGSIMQYHTSGNWLAASQITNAVMFNGVNFVEVANVEQPACPEQTIAIKWWSRIGGCWKSILLDVVGGGYNSDNSVDYWTDMVEDQLKGGTTYITARFPNATYKDYLYYSDIILGEHMTASVPVYGGFEDAPVKVSGNWSYKQNDIKDMDFTITIKQYDIDD